MNRKIINTKTICFCGLSIALAFICSYIKLFRLPFGGSVTLLSMFFICLPGLIYGFKLGILSSLAFSIITFVISGYYVSIPQVCLDYFLAFGLMGACGLFIELGADIKISFCIACVIRFICSSISGFVFFAEYAPSTMNPIVYSIVYNATYIFAEMIITVILLCLPPMKKVLKTIKEF